MGYEGSEQDETLYHQSFDYILYDLYCTRIDLLFHVWNNAIYILQAIMFSSFFSSALTFLLYPKQTYSHKRILFQQILYIVLVMCMIMTTIIIVSAEISLLSFIVNFLVVMALFFLMKYLLYKKDQATAEEINELLQQRKKRTTS
ncbi:hypothetical protein [Bacillus pumilus]|uniref:hypothetical protein n=1 Tax=Bacillus pumilus TaxID=1408 RepID=UPI0021CC6FB4|nr:hypothetical protein [Bacillus pumilus]